MSTLTLNRKRQATFPVRLCQELKIGPGDVVEVESVRLKGEQVWILRSHKSKDRPWLGCFSHKASAKDHSMEAIRSSFAAGRRKA